MRTPPHATANPARNTPPATFHLLRHTKKEKTFLNFLLWHTFFLAICRRSVGLSSRTRTYAHFTTNTLKKPKLVKTKVLGPLVGDEDTKSSFLFAASAGLNPGVGGAGVLLGPVGRPPYAGVEVHVAGGLQALGLRAVVGRGRVGDHLLQVRVLVPVGGSRVHSVGVVVPSALLLRVVQRLRGEERERFPLDSVRNATEQVHEHKRY